jgi:hypothetical protein
MRTAIHDLPVACDNEGRCYPANDRAVMPDRCAAIGTPAIADDGTVDESLPVQL